MNKILLNDLKVAIIEGHSFAIGRLRRDMYEYRTLCDKITAVQEHLESVIGTEYWETFRQFMQANENRADFEQRFMYIQGMRDYHNILQFLDDGALEKYLLDYDFKYDTFDDE